MMDGKLLRRGITMKWLLWAAAAHASGPRYVAGPPMFTAPQGNAVGWQSATPLYFTDPGALSVYVDKQAADALVAAATGVWNVPVANITLAQGGSLAEHVSGANVYLSSGGMVYPADVESSNYAAIPIAVIYDSDGSVTDTLLGGGASDPSGCRQNAVTESVDLFDPAGYIRHAIVILNGRCTGPAPEQQMQMQYQAMRAFGRILGLAWSQTNDNVFSGTPAPTSQQAAAWPIMHPMDVLCGSYSYQCLPQPFVLRADDIASLVEVYPVPQNIAQVPVGKEISLSNAYYVSGQLLFPTGQGMSGVNVVIQRMATNGSVPEPWQTASAVSGLLYRRLFANPVAALPASLEASEGTGNRFAEAYYFASYVPIQSGATADSLIVSTEPVNPLYTGSYAIGPSSYGTTAPSGSAQSMTVYGASTGGTATLSNTIADAASTCGNGEDGTAAAPVQPDPTGWWHGLLCGDGHAAWIALDVHPSRSLTLEVTALDELGDATTVKAMPVLGTWAATDSTSSLPTVASTVAAFNATSRGMTTLQAATGTVTGMTLAIADQRGMGRPDFVYQARVFYADTITPALVPVAGATVTIAGMGFRPGNAVTVNGVLATVVSWTANGIVVNVPAMSVANAVNLVPVDVVVCDLSTGATSTMSAALSYDAAGLPNLMKLLTAEVNPVYTGNAAAIPFAVQVLAGDGATPIIGAAVTFSVSVDGVAGGVVYSACSGASCVVATDAHGIASTGITPAQAGLVAMLATDGSLIQRASFTAIVSTGAMVVDQAPSGSVYAGVSAASPFAVTVFKADGVTPYAGRAVTFTTTPGAATFDACVASTCVLTTNNQGVASTGVTPSAAGSISLEASDGNLSKTVSFSAIANTPILKLASAPSGSYLWRTIAPLGFIVYLYQADGVTPMLLQPIVFTTIPLSPGATSAGVTFGPCQASPCTFLTNNQWAPGQAAVSVNCNLPGTYLLQASFGGLVQSATITVLDPTLQLKVIAAPAGSQAVGNVSATPFTVQLVATNGADMPSSGVSISLTSSYGQISFGVCPSYSCIVYPDATGTVTTSVTPLVVGPIVLSAVMQQISVSSQFTGVVNGDTMQLVSAPGNGSLPNVQAAVPLQIKLAGPGGIPAMAGRTVALSVSQGAALFGACGRATCSLVSDANGIVSTTVTPTATGSISLLAAEGGNSLTATFTVAIPPDILRPVSAPANGAFAGSTAAQPFTIQAVLWDGVTVLVGRTIAFSVTSGSATLGACGASSCMVATDSNGNASTTVEPLAAGHIGLSAADVAASLTTSFSAIATPVAASALAIQIIGGDGQSVTGGAAFLPVTAQVTDGAGHTVAGASVTILQTVTERTVACPARGRCPAAPVLASSTSQAISDGGGLVTIMPLTYNGVPTSTNIAVTVGTQGFATAVLERSP